MSGWLLLGPGRLRLCRRTEGGLDCPRTVARHLPNWLLVASSAVTGDFYKTLFKKSTSQKELVVVDRIAVVGIALIATMLDKDPKAKILELVSYVWVGFGAAFGPTILSSLLWNGMTMVGAIAGIITGSLTIIIWKQLQGGNFDLYELVPAFFISSISILW
jgi:sodium/proline symporter